MTVSPVHFGGVIRPNSGGTWFIQDDVDHKPLGLSSVTHRYDVGQGGHYLELSFSPTFAFAGSIIVMADDDLSGIGVTVAANMGINHSSVKLYRGRDQIDPRTLVFGNLWVLGFGWV